MKIVVLAGGLSPERDVSLSSSCLIANALMRKGHSVCLLDLYLGADIPEDMEDLYYRLGEKEFAYEVKKEVPDLERIKAESGNGESLIGKNVIAICKDADIVFLGLHGDIGENGKLQALFDVHGIDYTGSGHAGSHLAMDKRLTKILMDLEGIPNAPWKYYTERPREPLSLPCVIKPLDCGSSIGVSIVHDESEVEEALDYAFRYAPSILVEDYIPGREFSCGVLEGVALPPIEIKPLKGFYDYENKYQSGMTVEICPAELREEETAEMMRLALQVHEMLNLGSYSRTDFIMDDQGDFYALEVNTLPGMTPTSLIPQEAAAAGIDYDDLCEKVAMIKARK